MKAVIRKSEAPEPYSFAFVTGDGDILVRSENYSAKKGAANGVASVKKNCVEDKRYELKASRDGRFYFNLKAANGQIVATSPMFASDTERSNAIALMKSNAFDATEVDE